MMDRASMNWDGLLARMKVGIEQLVVAVVTGIYLVYLSADGSQKQDTSNPFVLIHSWNIKTHSHFLKSYFNFEQIT